MLNPNTIAPDFKLLDQDGKEHSLAYHLAHAAEQSDQKPATKFILVYFYPKDDTPGCTKEACTIAEIYGDFKANGVAVFGISADSPESHKKFAEKYNLPFTLLSDPTKETIKAYGAIKESGAFAGGTDRISYLIAAADRPATATMPEAKAGAILKVYPKVDPASHAGEILKDIFAMK